MAVLSLQLIGFVVRLSRKTCLFLGIKLGYCRRSCLFLRLDAVARTSVDHMCF